MRCGDDDFATEFVDVPSSSSGDLTHRRAFNDGCDASGATIPLLYVGSRRKRRQALRPTSLSGSPS